MGLSGGRLCFQANGLFHSGQKTDSYAGLTHRYGVCYRTFFSHRAGDLFLSGSKCFASARREGS